MNLIESYLFYLYLQEREWDTEEDLNSVMTLDHLKDIIKNLTGIVGASKINHDLQPSLYNIYIKNSVGDYKGRPDSINSRRLDHIGVEDFEKEAGELIKKIKFAQKIKSKKLSVFQKPVDDEPSI